MPRADCRLTTDSCSLLTAHCSRLTTHCSQAQLRAELTARGVQLPHGAQARGFYMELCRRHGVTRAGAALGAAASLPRYAAAPVVDYSNFRYAEGAGRH